MIDGEEGEEFHCLFCQLIKEILRLDLQGMKKLPEKSTKEVFSHFLREFKTMGTFPSLSLFSLDVNFQ
jgi:hypothetical protein